MLDITLPQNETLETIHSLLTIFGQNMGPGKKIQEQKEFFFSLPNSHL